MVNQKLIDLVIDQIRCDCAAGDYTAIEELLRSVPAANLIAFLPEGLKVLDDLVAAESDNLDWKPW